jgi:hypothetical protein
MKANFEALYDHIGYLFYALASEQKTLSKYDMKKLEAEISESWQPLTSAEASLHYSLIKHLNNTITNCQSDGLTCNNAFEVFEDYYSIHHSNFGDNLQHKILAAANEVSREFFSTSKDKNGSHLMSELKHLLHPHITETHNACPPAIVYMYKGERDENGLKLERVA